MLLLIAMFDTEHFISEIEARECLWNLNSKIHTDRETKIKAWHEVALAMYDDWHEKSAEEKSAIRIELQKKWRNIKDSFVKEVRCQQKSKSGSAKKKKKYVFFDILTFLLPQTENRKTESNNEETEIDEFLSCEIESIKEEVESNESTHGEDENDEGNAMLLQQPSQLRRKQRKRRKEECFSGMLLSFLATQQKRKEHEELDEDKSFFNCLLPSVKNLDVNQKMEFRLAVLTALKRIQNDPLS